VERELGADDIRRQLHNEAIMKSLQESPQAIERVLKDEVMVEPEKNSTADENGKARHDG
jgi:hypothetical protein